MDKTVKWHYIKDEGMPKVKGKNAKLFLICYRAELATTIEINGRKEQFPTGEFTELTTIALLQNHEIQRGFAYTPKNQFYWGPDIFSTAYAWAELPKPVEFKE